VLKDAESGVPVADLLRKHGVSKATFFKLNHPSCIASRRSRAFFNFNSYVDISQSPPRQR
jgi:hypothetical protein